MDEFKCKICGYKLTESDEKNATYKHGWCPSCKHPIEWSKTGKGYKPNRKSPKKLLSLFVFCIALLSYLSYCLYLGRAWLPFIRPGRDASIVEYTDQGYILAAIALASTLVCTILIITDHFDTRVNEEKYKFAQDLFAILAVISYCLSAFFGIEVYT
jgi:hypothetical protein